MPTLTWLDSFQHQNSAATFFGTNAGVYDTANTPANLTFVTGRRGSGSFALQVAQGGATITRVVKTVAAGNRTLVESFYIRITTIPSVNSTLWQANATINAGIVMLSGSGNLRFDAGSAGGQVVVTGNWADSAWHRIDLKFVTSATTYTMDVSIDGVAQTQSVSTTTTAADITQGALGSPTAAHTLTCQYADWVRSVTAGDHPIGAHQVLPLVATTDGTHSWASTNMGNEGGGLASSTTVLEASVDDWDPSVGIAADLTTYIAYTNTTATSTEYAELTLPDVSGTVWGARAVAAIFSATATANSATTRVVDGSNATVLDLYTGTMGQTALRHQAAMVPSITSSTLLNALKFRVGFPTDSNPAPRWSALMIDYATLEGTQTAQAVPATMTATIAMIRRSTQFVPAAMTMTAAIARRTGKLIAATVTGTAALTRRVLKPVAVALTGTVAMIRRSTQFIPALVALTVAMLRTKLKAQLVAITATLTAAIVRKILKPIPVDIISWRGPIANKAPPMSQWTVGSGSPSFNASLGEWTLSTAGDSVQSPFIRCDQYTDWALIWDVWTDTIGPPFSPNGGTLEGSLYYGYDKTTLVHNSENWTSNGDAQAVPAPLSTWNRLGWQYYVGGEVKYVRFEFRNDPTYSGVGGTMKVRNVTVFMDIDSPIDDYTTYGFTYVPYEAGPTILKRMTEVIAAVFTSTVVLATRKVLTKLIPATITATVAITRRTGKLVAATTTLTTAIARRSTQFVAATVTGTVAISRRVGKLVAVSVAGTVALVTAKLKQQLVAVTTTLTAALMRLNKETIAISVTATVALLRRILKPIAVPVFMSGQRVLNPGFESGQSPWVITGAPGWIDNGISTSFAHTGTQSWKMTEDVTTTPGNSRGVRTATTVPANPGEVWQLRGWVYAEHAVAVTNQSIRFLDSAGGLVGSSFDDSDAFSIPATGVWTEIRAAARTAPAGTAFVDLRLSVVSTGVAGRSYYLDDANGEIVPPLLAKRVTKFVAAAVTGAVAVTTAKLKAVLVAAASALIAVLTRRTGKLIETGYNPTNLLTSAEANHEPSAANTVWVPNDAGTGSGVVLADSTTEFHSGSASIRVSHTAPGYVGAYVGDPKPFPPFSRVEASIWIKRDTGTEPIDMAGYTYNSAMTFSGTINLSPVIGVGTGTWTKYTATGTTFWNTAYVRFAINLTASNTNNAWWQDDATMSRGAGVSMSAALTRKNFETVAAALTGTVVLVAQKAFQRLIAATTAFTVALTRRIGKLVPVTAPVVAALTRRLAETVAVTTSFAVVLARRTVKSIAVGLLNTVNLVATKIPGGQIFFQPITIGLRFIIRKVGV